jgi:hypothetical protein
MIGRNHEKRALIEQHFSMGGVILCMISCYIDVL